MNRCQSPQAESVKPLFEHAEEALKWAVEVLRRRRLPKTHSFFRELNEDLEGVAGQWDGRKNLNLPTDPLEKLHISLKVMEALEAVGRRDEEMGQMLQLWVWGDWADERRLAAALAVQEKCRREGLRVRLAYRYTYEQLAAIFGKDRKAVWRKVREGLELMDEVLVGKGLLARFEAPAQELNNFKKDVYFDEFKKLNE